MERLPGPQQAERNARGASVIQRAIGDLSMWLASVVGSTAALRSVTKDCEFTAVHFQGPHQ